MDTIKEKLSEYIAKNYSFEEGVSLYKDIIENENIIKKIHKQYDTEQTYNIIVTTLESEKECKEKNKHNLKEVIKVVSQKLNK